MNGSRVTSTDAKQPENGHEWVDDERWALALRVASSRQLVKAAQLRDILLYLCQRVLTDPGASIREYEIGCSVLGRRADFNPNDDNIVRVQISHLRKKLDEYFTTDGVAESLILSIPKGSYIPRFAPRVQPAVEEDRTPLLSSTIVSSPPQKVSDPPGRWRNWRIIVPVLALVLLSAVLALYRRQTASQHPIPVKTKSAIAAENFIWADIFDPSSPPVVVVADTCLVMLQDTLDTDISLADYIGGQYPDNLLDKVNDPAMRRTLKLLASRQYTSLGDVHVSSGLIELGRRLGSLGCIRYARHLNIRDFQNGNFVLIGSRRGNPWVGLFDQQLNFSIEEDRATHTFYFHNRAPRTGEPADYLPTHTSSNVAENYADIALVPNLSKNGYILILNGVTMETTEAAGQLLIEPDFSQLLRKVIKTGNPAPKSAEILIRVRSFGGAASNSEIVSYRVRT